MLKTILKDRFSQKFQLPSKITEKYVNKKDSTFNKIINDSSTDQFVFLNEEKGRQRKYAPTIATNYLDFENEETIRKDFPNLEDIFIWLNENLELKTPEFMQKTNRTLSLSMFTRLELQILKNGEITSKDIGASQFHLTKTIKKKENNQSFEPPVLIILFGCSRTLTIQNRKNNGTKFNIQLNHGDMIFNFMLSLLSCDVLNVKGKKGKSMGKTLIIILS